MADVADRLRATREAAGLTIEELSARTKIKPAMLHAIERGDFEQLPGEFFVRAFLRTYSRELHLPVDEIMADYDAAHPAAPVTPEPLPRTAVITDEQPRHLGWTVTAGVAVVLILGFVMTRPARQVTAEPQPVATSGTPASAVVATTGSAPAETMKIEIRPTRRLWVTGTADGERVLFRTLEPGEAVVLNARETMTFRVGDAGAFVYLLDGRPGTPPGRDGEVRQFTIDRHNRSAFFR